MQSEILVALIAAIASLVVAIATAVLNYVTKRRSDTRLQTLEHHSSVELARLNDRLTESRAERDAYRDYIYDAKKKLYTELQPLLFQQGRVI
jgi:signal transduction histidine kinase